MYLRHTTVSKNGKTRVYWRLVRSVRVGSKVRQETVAQLGELDAQGRVRARALAEAIVGIERQPGLFEDDVPAEPVAVKLQQLQLERGHPSPRRRRGPGPRGRAPPRARPPPPAIPRRPPRARRSGARRLRRERRYRQTKNRPTGLRGNARNPATDGAQLRDWDDETQL